MKIFISLTSFYGENLRIHMSMSLSIVGIVYSAYGDNISFLLHTIGLN